MGLALGITNKYETRVEQIVLVEHASLVRQRVTLLSNIGLGCKLSPQKIYKTDPSLTK